jgi:hypothetical protein
LPAISEKQTSKTFETKLQLLYFDPSSKDTIPNQVCQINGFFRNEILQ